MADPLDTTQPAAPPPAPFTPTGLTTGPLITPPGQTTDLDVPAGNMESLAPLQDTKDLGAYMERHGYMAGGPTGFLQNSPVQAGRGVAPQWTPAPTFTAELANERYGIPGHLKFDGDIPAAAAKSLHDQTVAYLQRQEILARQQGGFLNRTAQFGVGALNMALDPIDAASAFIPVVGEVRYAGWLAKASGAFERGVIRAGVGAAQGAVAQAPISALRFGLSYENQEDYSAVNALMDIAYGTLGGGGLHAAGGLAGDLLSGRFRKPTTRAAALSTASPIANMVDNAPLQVKDAALRTAVAQAVQGQPVDVRPYFEAWQGSPHEFEAHADEALGTGEGAAAYGVGHYVAESRGVAESYKLAGAPDFAGSRQQRLAQAALDIAQGNGLAGPEARTEAINELHRQMLAAQADKPLRYDLQDAINNFDAVVGPQAKGNVYKLAVEANPEHFLDWDKPLSEQSPEVKAAIANLPKDIRDKILKYNEKVGAAKDLAGTQMTGAELHAELTTRFGGDKAAAAKALKEAGIPGIRYLDQNSRGIRTGDATARGLAARVLDAVGGNKEKALAELDLRKATAGASQEFRDKVDAAKAFIQSDDLGTRNFVVFDPKKIRILEKNGQPIARPEPEAPKGSAASAAKAVTAELDAGPPRTVAEMRLTVERLNQKVAEFKAAGLDNVAELFAQKLRALGYEPGEMPADLSAAGEASGATATSETPAPPLTQDLPSQLSTPTPDASLTTRQNAPSILAGPAKTFTDLTLGAMDATSNRKIIQASTDLKQLHSLAVETRNEVNARLRDLLDDVPGADLVGVRAKDLPGLEKKAETRPASTISDYLGGRIALDGPEALTATLDKLRSSGRLLEVEDFLGSDKKQGYRAVHVQMDLGNGMSIELQLVPKEMLPAQKAAHDVYDTIKRINRDTASDAEWAKIEKATAQMRGIFDKAWKPIAEKWGHGGPIEAGTAIAAKFIKNDVAVLPGGEEVKVRYAIVDAKDLTASQLPSFEANPKYPAALQPRDRTRSASAVQVRTIAQKMNPKLLGENPNASDGAPIVGPDGVVESGNGRVMAIHMAYAEKMDTAGKYKAYLAEQGYPIDHLEEPVLVRIRDQAMTPEERAQFGRQANQRTTLAMGTAEEAKADAAAIPDHVLELHRGGDIALASNREFVTAFNRDVVGPNDRAGMMNKDGGLSVKGRQRIEAALLAKAYDDPGILAALLEDPESNIKAIGKAITDVSPRWALMRKEAQAGQINPKVDISRDLIDAVNLVRKAREQGIKINDLVTQGDAFSGNVSLETEAMLGIFFKPATKKGEVPFTKPNSMDKIAAALDRYVAEARKSAGGPGLFGGADVVGPQEILRGAGRQGETGEQPALFGEPRRSATAGGGFGDSGQSRGGESPPGQAPAGDSLGHALRTQADPNTGFADPEDLRGQAAALEYQKRIITEQAAAGRKSMLGRPEGASSPDVQAIESAMALDMERLDAAIKAGQVSEDEAASLSEADKLVSDAEDRAKGIDEAASCIGRGAI